ncbi:hypothetical protein OI18_11565 [Flavihumibacter solisilvae]|uniref:Uncharacterized protein n=2 Tax=Flavihumibacter solisilvae TaxID=1349421 RepID=A0A0C1LGS3_9BACT|nr:hypothetical protein OI18_11565 [Flavihumibacter solisilvae]
MKVIALFFAMLCFQAVLGQRDIQNFMDSTIQSLHEKGCDSIVGISYRRWNYPGQDTIPGFGDVMIYAEGYLLYKHHNKCYSQKFIDFIYSDGDAANGTFLASIPLELKNENFFALLRRDINQIRFEEVYPYIYTVIDPASKHIAYEKLTPSHETNYLLTFQINDEAIIKHVNPDHILERWAKELPKNLNYNHNASTKLVQYFNDLVEWIFIVENNFKYE